MENEEELEHFIYILANDTHYKRELFESVDKYNYFIEFFKSVSGFIKSDALKLKLIFHYEKDIDSDQINEIIDGFKSDNKPWFNRDCYNNYHIFLWKNTITAVLFDGNSTVRKLKQKIWFNDLETTKKYISDTVMWMYQMHITEWRVEEQKIKNDEHFWTVELPLINLKIKDDVNKWWNNIPEEKPKELTEEEKKELKERVDEEKKHYEWLLNNVWNKKKSY